MNGTFEQLETIAHNVIDKTADIAKGVAKAVVTLICLGGSIAYEAGVKLRGFVDNTQTETEVETNVEEPQTTDVEMPVEVDIIEDNFATEPEEVTVEVRNNISDLWEMQVEVVEAQEIAEDIIAEVQLLLMPGKDEEVIPEIDGKPAYYTKTGAGRCRKGYRKVGDRCVQIKYLRQQELAEMSK